VQVADGNVAAEGPLATPLVAGHDANHTDRLDVRVANGDDVQPNGSTNTAFDKGKEVVHFGENVVGRPDNVVLAGREACVGGG